MDQEEIDRQFHQFVQSWIEKEGKSVLFVGRDITGRSKKEDLEIQDTEPKKNYNWFSEQQMHMMDQHPFEEGCPVQLLSITVDDFFQSPLMAQAYHLMDTLTKKDLKLTTTNEIPCSMVEVLYELGTLSIPRYNIKKFTESSIDEVYFLHKVLKETGLVREDSGKMSLTEKGKTQLEDLNALVRTIITYLFSDFDTSCWDLRGDSECGNKARLYSLWLLHHFGNGWHGFKFYEKEYFKAFPSDTDSRTFSNRILKHLFFYLGLCVMITKYGEVGTKKSPLLDMMFSFEEPGNK